jgi:hypothetical protein
MNQFDFDVVTGPSTKEHAAGPEGLPRFQEREAGSNVRQREGGHEAERAK